MVRVQGRRKWRVQQCLTRVCWWHFYLQISQPQPSIVEWMIIALPAVGSSPSHVAPIVEKPPWWMMTVQRFSPFRTVLRPLHAVISVLHSEDKPSNLFAIGKCWQSQKTGCVHSFIRCSWIVSLWAKKNPCCGKGQLNYRCQPLQGQQTITNQ